ncbi:MAG: pyridoxal phosphate-dependent aminotransferase [Sandaracinaceae bacterium]
MSEHPLLELVPPGLRSLAAYRTRPDPEPIKLDANESPWPLPEDARRRLGDALARLPLHRYPDLGARELKAVLATRLGALEEELVIGVGSDEVIGLLLSALRQPRPDRSAPVLLVPTPTFVMYALTARVHGWEVEDVALDEAFDLTVDGFERAAARARPNLAFLASPNNPPGRAYRPDALRAASAAVTRTGLAVLDEAYGPFTRHQLAGHFSPDGRVGLLGTLSKVGLAGLRVGWARLPSAIAREVDKVRPPYNLSSLSQAAAALLLGELAGVLDAQVERITAERERLAARLAGLEGVTLLPSEANFLLLRPTRSAAAVHADLLARGIQVRAFRAPERLRAYLRVTVGTPDENDALLDALPACLAGGPPGG